MSLPRQGHNNKTKYTTNLINLVINESITKYLTNYKGPIRQIYLKAIEQKDFELIPLS